MFSFHAIILCLPLVLVLLALSFSPLLFSKLWHKRGNIILISIAVISIFISFNCLENPYSILKHTLCSEYLPFIITLFTLYVLSCGIKIDIQLAPTTFANLSFLFCSSVFASIIGTTGASVLFLRPFLEMNKNRQNKTHLVIFFIFLVSNIGGLLTPLGDPPLLIGYIHGIDFSWCFKNLIFAWACYIILLLLILAVLDKFILKKEKNNLTTEKQKIKIKIDGIFNIILLLCVVGTLFLNNILIKSCSLLIFCLLSMLYTKILIIKQMAWQKINFAPIMEVVVVFFVIFTVMAPVVFLLSENLDNVQIYLENFSAGEKKANIYFWLCGMLSSFLDNAPSYLLFFNIAGGNAYDLMFQYTDILRAISTSAVVMGAMTYIGNAPNMMVKSIAEKMHIKMPSFLGYFGWAAIVIVPISILINWFR